MTNLRCAAAVVLLWAASTHAQSALTGTWQGRTPSGFELVLELKATDGTLNGTLTRDGRSSAIAEGNVSKDTFTFNAALDERPEAFTGQIEADAIKVWLDRQGPSMAVTFKRVERGLSGTWQGKTPNGFPLVLELAATGGALTGTLIRDGQPATIANGKASKDTFTFEATLGGQTEALSGELAGNRLKIWLDRQGPSAAAVLDRVANVK